MKVAVFAYHNIGYECLKVLIEGNEEIVAVVTHQDDPGEEIWFRSVAELARIHHLPVYTPSSPNTPAFIDLMRRLAPDLIVSFYYRRLLSNELLAIPRLGGINLHGSLLPKYRGRCPVNWVLINGETETGVTLHYMIEKADAGDIIAQKPVPIDFEDTALSLFHKLTAAATQLLKGTFPLIKAGTAPRVPQDSRLATTFGGRRPEDGRIMWEWSAPTIHNLIRAVTHPYPGAFTLHGGRKLYLWEATFNHQLSTLNKRLPGTIVAIEKGRGMLVSTGEGGLLVRRVQFEGGEEMSAEEMMGRYAIPLGCRLGQ
ncbi:MAG: formyltransferase [Candidatus Binatia bacterium]